MSARKSSYRTIFLIVSSGSPLALIASSLRSTSKKPVCPMTRSLHPPMAHCGQRVRFVATWREEFFRGAQKALAKILPRLETEIVKRSDRTKGFVVLPRRWVVERTFTWLNRCRRLAKDWENLNRNALAFLRLASIRLMLRKLCNPA